MELILLFRIGREMPRLWILVSLLYDVNEVVAESAVSWDEKPLLLKDVFAELSRLV